MAVFQQQLGFLAPRWSDRTVLAESIRRIMRTS
jgi:hypothetical protein